MGQSHRVASTFSARLFQPIADFSTSYVLPGLFGIILLGYCLQVTVLPPQVGMADNGDFAGLMATIGLKHSSENRADIYFNYFRPYYSLDEKSDFLSCVRNFFGKFPASLFTTASALINRAVGNSKTYNIIYLGALYSFFYCLAFFLFIQAICKDLNIYSQFLVCLLAGLIYSDSLFITYFNSFYQEPVFLITFLLFMSVIIRKSISSVLPEILVFSASVSRIQNLIFSIFYAFPFFTNARRIKFVLFLVILSLVLVWTGSSRTREQSIFNSYFNGVLVNHPNKEKALADFRLHRQEYLNFVGKSYWDVFTETTGNKDIRKDFYSKVTLTKITLYYARNPQLLLSKLSHAFSYIRSTDPGSDSPANYSREYGRKRYSGLTFFSHNMAILTILIPIIAVVSMILSLFGKRLSELFVMVILFAALPLTVVSCIVCEGFRDFSQRLFPFYSVLAVVFTVCTGNMLRHLPSGTRHQPTRSQ